VPSHEIKYAGILTISYLQELIQLLSTPRILVGSPQTAPSKGYYRTGENPKFFVHGTKGIWKYFAEINTKLKQEIKNFNFLYNRTG